MLSILRAAGLSARILVLSGGSNPSLNHYSQYLQTKTLTEGLRARFGAASTAVLFGAGNDRTPVVADVHKETPAGDALLQDLLFGVIPGNAPATRAGVKAFFAAGPAAPADGAFFLFVSDHGMPQPGAGFDDNCINLWGYDAGGPARECLAKDELRALIKANVKARRTVFAMSQCFSGGFHQMAVTRAGGYPAADASICGFTAVTEDTTASGCTADVDGPGYQGYERYFTENLVGKDVVSGAARPRAATVHEAHERAAAEDRTKDIPLATSDYYLREWGNLIADPAFQPRSGAGNTAVRGLFEAILDGQVPDEVLLQQAGALAPVVKEKLRWLAAQVALMGEEEPDLASMLASGSRQELQNERDKAIQRLDQLDAAVSKLDDELNALYARRMVPQWAAAVARGGAGLSAAETALEEGVPLAAETAGKNWRTACVLAQSRLASAGDRAGYEALRAYCAGRNERVHALFARLTDRAVTKDWDRIRELSRALTPLYEELEPLEPRRDHIRRVLILRAEIAAAVALAAMGDAQAVRDTLALAECEKAAFD